MKLLGRRLRLRRSEEGAVAILMAVLCVLLFMFAAFSVDIAMQINRKHQLIGTLDAAAQAGASKLPLDTTAAQQAALNAALVRDATETGTLKPNVDFWCIVGAVGTSAPYSVDASQIPGTCYPGTTPYTVNANYKATGRKITCSSKLCAIPCVIPTPNTGTPKFACNTIRVYQGRDVPFTFAPAGGIPTGSTGSLVSVACKGPCGTIPPNPMDVAVVADRTGSMSENMASLRSGIQGMLKVMTPSQQYVALGTLGKSAVSTTPTSEPSGSSCYSDDGSGTWVPIPFSNNYVTAGTTTLNSNSALVKATTCLPTSSSGTSLASPLKAAARYLLGSAAGASNNLSSLPARSGPAAKVLIMETDGQPNEPNSGGGGNASLSNATDIYSGPAHATPGNTTQESTPAQPTTKDRKVGNKTYKDVYNTTTITNTASSTADGGQKACQNLLDVAANAKAAGIRVITIAYNLGGNTCGQDNSAQDSGTTTNSTNTVITQISPTAARQGTAGNYSVKADYAGVATVTQTTTISKTTYNSAPDSLVTTTLAAAASPVDGVPSAAQNTCKTAAEQSVENADGDNFFCAVAGADLAPIFKTALAQASSGIKLLNLP